MSSDRLISQQELDTLSSSLDIAEGQSSDDSAEVALYDFENAAQLSPDQFHALGDKCEVLSKVLTRTLTAYLNCNVSVDFEGLDRLTFDQYIRGLPSNPIFASIDLDSHSADAVWQIDNMVAVALVTAMLGSSSPPSSPPQDLTPIEASLLNTLFTELLETWTLTWSDLTTLDPTVEDTANTVAALEIGSDAQQIVHAVLRFHLLDISGPSNLALPLPPLQRLLRGDDTAEDASSEPEEVSLESPPARHTVNSSVELAARIARLRLPLSKLADLEEGDVIPLNTHVSESLELAVSGESKFAVERGRSHGHVAVRILEPLDQS